MFWRKPLEKRYPSERLAALPLVIIGKAVSLAAAHGLDRAEILNTRFMHGYLSAFPGYLDEREPQLGGAIRRTLFVATYGAEEGDDRFRKTLACIELDDPQARRGIGFGQPDGARYFEALEQGRSTDDCFTSLEAAFQIGSVDIQQTVIV